MHYLPEIDTNFYPDKEEWLIDSGKLTEEIEVNNDICHKIKEKRYQNDMLYNFCHFGKFID